MSKLGHRNYGTQLPVPVPQLVNKLKYSTSKDVPIADRGELVQGALMAYAYLPQFWNTLTSF